MRKLYLALLMTGLMGSVSAQTCINTFPYTQDFEGAHGWTTGSSPTSSGGSWILGTPAKTIIQGAASGTKAWVTSSLTANYLDSQQYYVQSPCFNLSALSNPVVDLKIWYHTEATFDGANLQSSIDGGVTWQDVGTYTSGYNWYNDNVIEGLLWTGSQSGWQGSSPQGGTGYIQAKHDLTALSGKSNVRFRMSFGSDQLITDEGVAFDDFRIYQKPAVDLQVTVLPKPQIAAGGCTLSNNQAITMTVENVGAQAQSGIQVSYQITATPGGVQPMVTAFLPGVLSAGQSTTYTFNQRADLSAVNTTYSICATVTKTGDTNIGNNTLCTTAKNFQVTVGYVENFDSFAQCGNTANAPVMNSDCNDNLLNGWLNAQNDDQNWSVGGSSGTPSLNTGPLGDHTGNGNFLFTEASDALNIFGKTFNLESPCINLVGVSNPGISFWYHMYGANMGDLHVDVYSNGAWVLDALTLISQQQITEGDPYFQALVPLNSYAGQVIKVRFRGETGPNFESDIAIDDFEVTGTISAVADAGVLSINGLASGCNLSNATQICVSVKNFGTSAISNVPVSYTINGGSPVTASVPGPIAAGATATYCFNQTANLSAAGNYTIVATSALSGDATASNNSSTTTITASTGATVTFGASVPSTVCSNATAVTLVASPAGGTFSGPGVTGSSFNPATSGTGAKTITYTYTNAGCTSTGTKTIQVNAAPSAGVISGLSNACTTSGVQNLTASPAGGVFAGPGISGNTFNPATAGAGTHTITYTRTSAGCSTVTSQTVTITTAGSPTIVNQASYCAAPGTTPLSGAPSGGTFTVNGTAATTLNTATPGTYNVVYTITGACGGTASKTITVKATPTFQNVSACQNAGVVTLSATPAGGTFSGPGVTGNTFDPTASGVVVGANQVTYTPTGANPCPVTATVTVTAPPVITNFADDSVCNSGGNITLTPSPSGGIFSGPGITPGGVFDPSSVSLGAHTVYYLVGGASGCATADSAVITVTGTAITIATPAATICSNASPITLSASPAGGGFIGNGVSGNVYTPSAAGNDTISYVITDVVTGCVSSSYIVMTVNAAPTVNLTAIGSVCSNDGLIALTATPAGGTFSGTGVTGSNFNPATAGADSVTYTYTDPVTNCSATALTVATVKTAPSSTFTATPQPGIAVKFQASPPTPAATYSWDFGDGGTASTVSPPTHNYAAVGNYDVTLKVTKSGCVDSTTTTITVNITSVREDLTQGVNLYPNPTKGQVVVELARTGIHQLEVYNIQGQRVLMQTLTPQSKQLLDVSSLAAGAYVVRITGDHTNFIKQLVIEQ